jgi:hypothetical protein
MEGFGMGFYLRKSFGFGPLRLNLSKSGLGASFGVKGARIGVNAKGQTYVHAGHAGFYFRETLRSAPPKSRADGQPPRVPSAERVDERVIESEASYALTDAAQQALVAELTRIHQRTSRVRIVGTFAVLILGGVTAGWLGSLSAPDVRLPWAWFAAIVVLGICAAFAFSKARAADERDGKVNLSFDLESDAAQRFTSLSSALVSLASCQRVWVVEKEQNTGDWKRNAGATTLVGRTVVQPASALPRGVESTHEVMCLPAGQQTLYFFPNALMVYDSHGVGAISYNQLKCEVGDVAFRENTDVPSDAQLLHHTWRYVNKNGGPDRRFSNNRQLPVMRYGVLTLTSTTGLNEMFQVSNPDVLGAVQQALSGLHAVHIESISNKPNSNRLEK